MDILNIGGHYERSELKSTSTCQFFLTQPTEVYRKSLSDIELNQLASDLQNYLIINIYAVINNLEKDIIDVNRLQKLLNKPINIVLQMEKSIEKKSQKHFISAIKSFAKKLDNNVYLLLETSAHSLDDIINIHSLVNHSQIGICLNTYNYEANQSIEYLQTLESKIDIKNIRLIHLNDSENQFGENITSGLRQWIYWAYKKNIPIILQTKRNIEKEINKVKEVIQQVNQNIFHAMEKLQLIESLYGSGRNYKAEAYEKALVSLKQYPFEILNVKQLNLPGIGKSIKDKINQLLTSNKIDKIIEHQALLHTIEKFTNIPYIGTKTAKKLYDKGIKSIRDLKKNKKELTNSQQLGLKYYKDLKTRIPREDIMELENKISTLGFDFTICGSYRRGNSTCGDIDIVIHSLDGKEKLNDILDICGVIGEGEQKYTILIKLKGKIRHVDILFTKNVAPAILYLTGSRELNIRLRQIANDKGYLLNEYGLYKKSKLLKTDTEESIFNLLGLEYIEPKDR